MFSSSKLFFAFTKKEPSEWTQMGSDLNGASADDNFGHSVSLSKDGTALAVGSPKIGSDGYVKIYRWIGGEWMQVGSTIQGSQDRTGWSVSIDSSGQTVAVGSPYASPNGINSGKVSVYRWQDSDWAPKGSVISGDASGDQAGYSLDISDDGDFIYIGAIYNDSSGRNAGQVKAYDWNGTEWVEDAEIRGKVSGDLAGFSVSGSGDLIAIGSIFNDDSGTNSGKVSIYEWDGTSWIQKGSDINGESSGDQSGFSVSMSGNGSSLAIGAPFNDGGGTDAGHTRVYEWNGVWSKKSNDIDGENPGDGSGHSVSMNEDGSLVAIGAIYNDGNGNNSGHVRVYGWNESSWTQVGSDIDGKNPEDQSGSGKSISLSGDGKTIAIGAPYNDTSGINSGHVRVFRYS